MVTNVCHFENNGENGNDYQVLTQQLILKFFFCTFTNEAVSDDIFRFLESKFIVNRTCDVAI